MKTKTTPQTFYDISLPISESIVVWPGDKPVTITQPKHLDRGDDATVSHLSLGAHVGTHVDAPAHFVRNGSLVNDIDLNILIGPAMVVEALDTDVLSAGVIKNLSISEGIERVLFRTRNSEQWETSYHEFNKEYVGITEDGALWLVSKGIRLVGMDYLSVATFDEVTTTHRALLQAGIVLVEGLNLSRIAAGIYDFICLPLKIEGAEGAPARAILMDRVTQS